MSKSTGSKLALAFIALAFAQGAKAGTLYELTFTNGSQMPLSPGLLYAKSGGDSAATLGSSPSAGFVQLCQSGNPATRAMELRANSQITVLALTSGPVMPGESKTFVVEIANPAQQSLHLETMYGKSKEACAVGSINSHSLVALREHVSLEVTTKDNTLLAGAFTDPTLPSGMYPSDPRLCPNAMTAIDCLRSLSTPVQGMGRVRQFAGYSPALLTALEMRFGAADVQTLVFPTAGAVQLKLKLKH